eukprot:TRINITY_DN3053_c0_g1_i2.p1 TRINITY_DN3053_c0_g1~~TRINITY_DN3053_c0_g1_i2.p1  ORF type:complete len:475 (-),score=103.01 TRINITY_DN3053_c0_g1_i2:68-1492(-)
MQTVFVSLFMLLFVQIGADQLFSTKDGYKNGTGLNITPSSQFGSAVTFLGDIDKNGVDDIAVGNQGDNKVWILLLNSDDSLNNTIIIPNPSTGTQFGFALCNVGDRDGNGVSDLVVGTKSSGDWWIFFMERNGTSNIKKIFHTEIADAIADIGDVDNDTISDLVVSKINAFNVLFMSSSKGVNITQKFSVKKEYPQIWGNPGDNMFPELGRSVVGIGDSDGDSVPDVMTADSANRYLCVFTLHPSGQWDRVSYMALVVPIPSCNSSSCQFGAGLTLHGDIDGNRYNDVLVAVPGLNRVESYFTKKRETGDDFLLPAMQGMDMNNQVKLPNGQNLSTIPTSISSNSYAKGNNTFTVANKYIAGLTTYTDDMSEPDTGAAFVFDLSWDLGPSNSPVVISPSVIPSEDVDTENSAEGHGSGEDEGSDESDNDALVIGLVVGLVGGIVLLAVVIALIIFILLKLKTRYGVLQGTRPSI